MKQGGAGWHATAGKRLVSPLWDNPWFDTSQVEVFVLIFRRCPGRSGQPAGYIRCVRVCGYVLEMFRNGEAAR